MPVHLVRRDHVARKAERNPTWRTWQGNAMTEEKGNCEENFKVHLYDYPESFLKFGFVNYLCKTR